VESRILSRTDLAFLLYDWLKVEALTERPAFAEHSRETFDAVLELCERLATDKFANHNRKGDLEEAHLVEGTVRMAPEVSAALAAYTQAGLMAGGHPYELGGMQLPMVVERAGFAWFLAANMATSAIPFLTIANANLLLAYGMRQTIDLYVRPMLAGRFFGTMCLSEPHAGSGLSQLQHVGARMPSVIGRRQ
jgi:alkylation response protein AidB-like acyl-CoA dehydrogenase